MRKELTEGDCGLNSSLVMGVLSFYYFLLRLCPTGGGKTASLVIYHGNPFPSWLQFEILPSLHHLETVACVTPYFSTNSRVPIASLIYVIFHLL